MPTSPPAGVRNLSGLNIDVDKDWSGYSILNFVADLGDDQKIFLGADDDYSIRYDSTDDTFYVRDENQCYRGRNSKERCYERRQSRRKT